MSAGHASKAAAAAGRLIESPKMVGLPFRLRVSAASRYRSPWTLSLKTKASAPGRCGNSQAPARRGFAGLSAALGTADRTAWLLIVLLVLLVCTGCATERTTTGTVEQNVRAVLDRQVRHWNGGDLAGFMEGYDKSERTRFASGGDVNLGFKTVFDRYRKRYGDRAAMGTLTFSDVDITVLAPDAAVVFGRYKLQREKDAPTGLFTLLFRKTGEGWRIVHDHTSSAPTN